MTNISPWLRRASAICVTLCLLALCLLIWQDGRPDTSTPTNDGSFTLQPPAFLKSVYAQNSSFLTEEAGVTAYVNVGKAIDLERVERIDALRSITKQTDEYISGSMVAPGYDEITEFQEIYDIQIFIHREGWILAYLLSDQSEAHLIDWVHYHQNHLDVTTLENTLRHVMSRVGAADGEVAYYDFRHPSATHLMLIADHEELDRTTDYFDIKIPTSFELFESSLSHVGYRPYQTSCSLNDKEISQFGFTSNRNGWVIRFSKIEPFELQTGKVETIATYHNSTSSSWSACGLILIYKEN